MTGGQNSGPKPKTEVVYEKRVTPFGNSARLDASKRYRGWMAYVVIGQG